jgi:hypothetical protein
LANNLLRHRLLYLKRQFHNSPRVLSKELDKNESIKRLIETYESLYRQNGTVDFWVKRYAALRTAQLTEQERTWLKQQGAFEKFSFSEAQMLFLVLFLCALAFWIGFFAQGVFSLPFVTADDESAPSPSTSQDQKNKRPNHIFYILSSIDSAIRDVMASLTTRMQVRIETWLAQWREDQRAWHGWVEKVARGEVFLDEWGETLMGLPTPLPRSYARPLTVVISLEAVLHYSERFHTVFRTRIPNPDALGMSNDPRGYKDIKYRLIQGDLAMPHTFPRKRPGFDAFLAMIHPKCETVLFTDLPLADVALYFDHLNQLGFIDYCLTRDNGISRIEDVAIKDLTLLNRPLSSTVLIDSRPNTLHVDNVLFVSDWDGFSPDSDLLDILPFIEFLANHVQQGGDVRDVLRMYRGQNIPALYRERERMAIARGGVNAMTFPSTLGSILSGKRNDWQLPRA